MGFGRRGLSFEEMAQMSSTLNRPLLLSSASDSRAKPGFRAIDVMGLEFNSEYHEP